MKRNAEINKQFVEPLNSVIGAELIDIRAQDDLKYWELEFGNGKVLYFDTMSRGGFFGVVVDSKDE